MVINDKIMFPLFDIYYNQSDLNCFISIIIINKATIEYVLWYDMWGVMCEVWEPKSMLLL